METTRSCCSLLPAAKIPEVLSHGPWSILQSFARAQPCECRSRGRSWRRRLGAPRPGSGAGPEPPAAPGRRSPRRPQLRGAQGRARSPGAAAAAAAEACGDYSPFRTTGAATLRGDAKQIKEPVRSKTTQFPPGFQ